MNKPNSTKKSFLSKKPERMRVFFKKRNNHRGTQETIQRNFSLNHIIEGNPQTDFINKDKSVSQLKSYVKYKMKTEYTSQFQGLQLSERQQSSFQKSKIHLDKKSSLSCIQVPKIQIDKLYRIIGSNQKQQDKSHIQNLTLEEIEDKLQKLMRKRLNDCLGFKQKKDWDLQSEMSKLLDAMKYLKEEQNPEGLEPTFQYVNKKIAILQKLIAQNATESEIMKKYYLLKASNFHKTHKKSHSISMQASSLIKRAKQKSKQSVISSSINMQTYKKPNQNAYRIYKHQNSFFNADRHKQPLPRSSYNREYLISGISVISSPHKPEDTDFIRGHSSANVIDTSYKSSFGPKIAEHINIRQLDAYRDKFKNLPIIFGRKEKEQLASKFASYLKQKAKDEKNQEQYDKTSYIAKYLRSESRRQFSNDHSPLISQIKHQNLEKMKYEYKKQFHV